MSGSAASAEGLVQHLEASAASKVIAASCMGTQSPELLPVGGILPGPSGLASESNLKNVSQTRKMLGNLWHRGMLGH